MPEAKNIMVEAHMQGVMRQNDDEGELKTSLLFHINTQDT